MEYEDKELISDGSDEKIIARCGLEYVAIREFDNSRQIMWDGTKILDLLNDGRKYRLLKKAEEIKRDMLIVEKQKTEDKKDD